MSIQAFLFRQVIRQSIKSPAVMGTIKNRLIPTEMGIAGVRGGINEALARITRVPSFVQVQDVDAGGVPAEWIRVPESDKDAVLIYLHGGAYVLGSAETHRNLAWRLAVKARCRVLLVDYRLAPEHPYPAPVEDAIAAYDWVLEQGFDPSRIGISGDSAGGGLTFATLAKIKDTDRPMPAVAFGISPWTDLACTGKSLRTNAKADPMFDPGAIPRAVDFYLQGADPYDPYASPLYADFEGFPPTMIHVGSSEILLDDARRLAHNMKEAGVLVELEVWRNMPHVWHVFAPFLPESTQAISRGARFLLRHMAEGRERRSASITYLENHRKAPISRAPRRHATVSGEGN